MKIWKRVLSIVAAMAVAVGLAAVVPEEAYADPGYDYKVGSFGLKDASGTSYAAGFVVASGKVIYGGSSWHNCDIYIDNVCVASLYDGPGTSNLYTATQDLCYVGVSGGGGTSGSCYFTSVATPEDNSHTHNYVYTVITGPTEDSDGEAAYVCSCGDSINHEVISSAYAKMDNRESQIEQAKAGQTITLNMGLMNSLPKWFMAKIAEKNNANFKLQIEYNHQKYEISIPAGTKVDLNEEWYGPLKLMSLYATSQMN